MTTEQTAQQLELAAQILRTGHPFEVRHDASDRWHASLGVNPAQAVLQDWHLRPVLATPPDNRPLHNPDNLTAEQVGVGYRLTVEGESPHEDAEMWMQGSRRWAERGKPEEAYGGGYTYRLPLSVPWPEPEKPDPYAELKAAHAAGKVIQGLIGGYWIDSPHPTWKYPVDTYRVKPDEPEVCAVVKPEPAFQLPPPPPSMRWHREDGWKSDDLPSGYRPLAEGEVYQEKLDEMLWDSGWEPLNHGGHYTNTADGQDIFIRTTRPLTFQHAGKTWTWHKPGDPMPCEGDRDVCCLVTKGSHRETNSAKGRYMGWSVTDETLYFWGVILGWRYADEKKTVPLGRGDVTPLTRLRVKVSGENHTSWITPLSAAEDGVVIATPRQVVKVSWESLLADYERNESLATGKWNPDAWEPCSKTIPA